MKNVKATKKHKEAALTLHRGGHIDVSLADDLLALGWIKNGRKGQDIALTPEGLKVAQRGAAVLATK